MERLKRILVGISIFVNILILVFVLIIVFSTVAGNLMEIVPADCYVNGEWLKSSAILSWYKDSMVEKSPPMVKVPFFETLKKLGCQIEREENADGVFATIRVNGREFSLVGDNYLALYENDQRLVYAAERLNLYRGSQKQGTYGPFYMYCYDHGTFEELLKALGFDNITFETDGEPWVVRITAYTDG